ncbi:hypothetical protein GCM10029976_068340 [Kribbella albertanoniae]
MLVPVAAAAAVLLVVSGLAVAGSALKKDDAGTPVAGQAQIQELPTDAANKLQSQCLAEAKRITANGIKQPFRDYTVVRTFEITGVQDPKVVNTWLIGKGTAPMGLNGEPVGYFWLCSRTAGGVISESSVRTPQTDKLVDLPVRPIARNAGVVAAPVVRVTVELAGEPAQEAHLLDGFWFAATEGRVNWGPYDKADPAAKTAVIRGYDAGGQQIFASTDKHPNCQSLWDFTGKRRGNVVQTDPPEPVCPTFPWP